MKNMKYIINGCLALAFCVLSNAQTATDDVIFKALNDEMARSLTSLKLDKFSPPFFIGSYLSDGKTFSAKASLGALIRSKESPTRSSSYRLMVGSYELNDENFQGGSESYNSGGVTLSLPKENDYFGIRRAFWSMNDRSYKNSIDTYTQKLTAIKQQNKEESEKLNDYTRMSPVTFLMKDVNLKYDKALWEKNVKDMSAIFRNYPKIQSSSVDVYFINSTVYVLNSEGSKIRYTAALACVAVNASTQADDGEVLRDQLTYYALLSDQLPSVESMSQDIKKMAQVLETRCSAPIIAEPYQGPVVFEGEALAELFNFKFFGGNGLLTSREPVYAAGASRGSVNKMETKIGKRICAENISIVSSPGMKNFGNTPLIGSFGMDAEGVSPTDGLVLVDKGILKTQLSDRIPTSKVKQSNGHYRFNIWGGRQKAPGVIRIGYDKGQSYNDFLKTVSSETERSGLEYYYIIRCMETGNLANQIQVGNSGLPKPIAIYKVSVKTGEEQLIRSAVISEFPMLSFKYVLAGTADQAAINTLRGSSMPVSYIVPKAIAFNDVSIEKDNTPKSKLPVVSNPLIALK
jgi:predicted Zn-dependent protease